MNIRQLEAFRATYLMGSVSRAGETLNISQPSVSRLISDLERSAGLKLFNRTARGLVPTAEGRALYNAVERAFVGLQEIRSAADAIRNIRSGTISLGVIPAFAYSVFPAAAAQLHEESPDLQLAVNIRTSEAVIQEIETGRADVGLISPIREHLNVSTFYQVSTRFVCLLPSAHALAGHEEPIDLTWLGKEEFISFDNLYLSLISDPRIFQFISSRTRFSSHSSPVVAALSEATGRPAIVDPFTASFIARSGRMAVKPLAQDIRFQISIVGRKDLSLAAQRLVAILANDISQWINDPRMGFAGYRDSE